eukprot:TRINITY_DN19032_c0_g1_i1.p4 TRINITY_DN19032_c0_g1~~TRINITY_DN19032_c0_g1_i1.p4  ORF type:complete len:209 (+),score=46.65 TRINITY_DN19032_c0_g1_i1:63-629(+)
MGWVTEYCTSAVHHGHRVLMLRATPPPTTEPLLIPEGVITIRRYDRRSEAHIFRRKDEAPKKKKAAAQKPQTSDRDNHMKETTAPQSTKPQPQPQAQGVPGSELLPKQPKAKKVKKQKPVSRPAEAAAEPQQAATPPQTTQQDHIIEMLRAQLAQSQADMQKLHEQKAALQSQRQQVLQQRSHKTTQM